MVVLNAWAYIENVFPQDLESVANSKYGTLKNSLGKSEYNHQNIEC